MSSIERPNASPSPLRSSLTKPEALADPMTGGRPAPRDPLDPDPPRADRVEPEDRAQQLGPPRPDQPRDPQDLAAPDAQVGAPRQGPPGQLAQLEHDLARLVRDVREELGQVAADHLADDRRELRPRHRPRGHRPAVAEHRVAPRDPADFLQEVADVDDREPSTAQPLDHLEQPRGVALGQRAGRLVEDDDPGVRDQGPGDLDQLLGPHAERPRDRLGPDVGMLQQLQGLARPAGGARADGSGRRVTRSWPSMTLASTVRCGASASSW